MNVLYFWAFDVINGTYSVIDTVIVKLNRLGFWTAFSPVEIAYTYNNIGHTYKKPKSEKTVETHVIHARLGLCNK